MDTAVNSKKERSGKKFFIEHVARFCDRCGRAYKEEDIEILQRTDYSVIIHFGCPNCKARHLATFIKPLGITSRVPVNTDLGIEELSYFAGRRGISTNDVLDVHDILKSNDLTVRKLMRMARRREAE